MAKRSYFEEINEIENTWDNVISIPPIITNKLTSNWFTGNAFCVGSGGSFSLAKLWQNIHEKHRLGIAKAITPYEYYQSKIKPDIVFLFSASGKNKDILNVFKKAATAGCRIFIFSTNPNSALARLSKTHSGISSGIFPGTDTPKDGFLAVNSIIAMTCLMLHLEINIFGENFTNIEPVKNAIADHKKITLDNNLAEINTIQIIASDWGGPAGNDLESRLAESSIFSCFLTDPRNFGHGRFLWIDKRLSSTLIVLFYTEVFRSFIEKYIRKFPDGCNIYKIYSPYEATIGSIYCLTRSILLFGLLAKLRDIDPGKPKVPEWGRKLHSLQFNNKKSSIPIQNNNKFLSFQQFSALSSGFSGIVMDYDGTLVDTKNRYNPIRKEIIDELERLIELGLRIGIATGRGKSAFNQLKNQISPEIHRKVFIGLYNGTIHLNLSEQLNISTISWPTQSLIKSILNGICPDRIEISHKPTHISIRNGTKKIRNDLLKQILSKLGQYSVFINYKTSGHSIDIFPAWGGKLSVVESITKLISDKVLCIGDQGQLGGNDEELLAWRPSICVGKDKPFSNSCLWVGKNKNFQESSGTLLVLKNIHKFGSNFKLKLNN